MWRFYCLYACIICGVVYPSICQSPISSPDSLLHYLVEEENARIAKEVYVRNKELLKKAKDSTRIAIYNQLAFCYGMTLENDSALFFLNQAFSIGDSARWPILRAHSFNNMGNVQRGLSENEAAMQAYLKGVNILQNEESEEAWRMKARLIGNIGGIYYDLRQYEKSLEYALKSQEISERFQFSDRYFIGHLMLSFAYRALGENEKALGHNFSVLELLGTESGSPYLAHTYYNIGAIYTDLNKNDEARTYIQRSIAVAETVGEYEVLVSNWIELVKLDMRKSSSRAWITALEGEKLAVSYALLPKHIELLELMESIKSSQTDFKSAYDIAKQLLTLKDSLFTIENANKIAELERKYEKKQDRQIIENFALSNKLAKVEIKRRQNLLWLVSATFVSFLVIIWLIFRLYRQKALAHQIKLNAQLDEYRNRLSQLLGKSEAPVNIPIETINSSLKQPISEKEYEVLVCIFEDKTNKEIAEKLEISINTVKFHFKNIYEKLGVTNRREAMERLVGDLVS